MNFLAHQPERNDARDATHRGGISDTHPTHACIEKIRRLPGAPMARSVMVSAGNDAFAPLPERVRSALRRWSC